MSTGNFGGGGGAEVPFTVKTSPLFGENAFHLRVFFFVFLRPTALRTTEKGAGYQKWARSLQRLQGDTRPLSNRGSKGQNSRF